MKVTQQIKLQKDWAIKTIGTSEDRKKAFEQYGISKLVAVYVTDSKDGERCFYADELLPDETTLDNINIHYFLNRWEKIPYQRLEKNQDRTWEFELYASVEDFVDGNAPIDTKQESENQYWWWRIDEMDDRYWG